jgi:glycerol-3-phosphate dehydrogenase
MNNIEQEYATGRDRPHVTARAQRLQDLATRSFDVVIVGAGIYGATLACAAARSGLSVALIDKGDYGSGASANSMKILHGGLRYLQQMNLPRMRQSILARRDGLRSLPHLTSPTAFLAPTGPSLTRCRWAYEVAARLNDLISLGRNHGVPAALHLPRTRVLSAAEMKVLVPALQSEARHALLWHDVVVRNTERYTLAYVLSARESGAVTVNHVAALSLQTEQNRVTGVAVRDELGGASFTVKAALTVNTTSAWRHDWEAGDAPTREVPWVRSMNIIVRKQWFGPCGVGVTNGGRNFFFVPFRDATMIGTSNEPHTGSPDQRPVTHDDLARFIERINQVYPAVKLRVEDVSFVHAGVLPGRPGPTGVADPEPDDRTSILWGGPRGDRGNYLVVQGVKYTTAAYWADTIMPHVLRRLPRRPGRTSKPVRQPLYGAEAPVSAGDLQASASAFDWSISVDMAQTLWEHFGARAGEVIALARDARNLREGIPGTLLPKAAIVYAVIHEDAVHLDDVLSRRTDIGALGRPPPETCETVCGLMAALDGWDGVRCATEHRRVENHYAFLGLSAKRPPADCAPPSPPELTGNTT